MRSQSMHKGSAVRSCKPLLDCIERVVLQDMINGWVLIWYLMLDYDLDQSYSTNETFYYNLNITGSEKQFLTKTFYHYKSIL